MADVALKWRPDGSLARLGSADLAIAGGDLATGDELQAAVVMSLFTWRRADRDDRPRSGDRQGWWGDALLEPLPDGTPDRIGSRLWAFLDETLTVRTLERLRQAILEALDWLVQDGVAARIDVALERPSGSRADPNRVHAAVTIWRSDGRRADLRFDDLWSWVRG